MTGLENVTPEETDIALKIAGIVFGGVSEDSQQFQTCLAAARKLAGDPSITSTNYTQATDVFQRCRDFNLQHPVGTEGKIFDGGELQAVRVEQGAMVFPSPSAGAVPLAFFSTFGWRDIRGFVKGAAGPTLAEEIVLVGVQCKQQARHEMAQYMFRAALLADPDCWHALNERGLYLSTQQEFAEALEFYDHCLRVMPTSGEVLNNRATVLMSLGRCKEAVDDCRAAMKLLPMEEGIALVAASALNEIGEIDECLAIIDRHLAANPHKINVRYNRSLTLLAAGRMAEGWDSYDSRLKQPGMNATYEHYNIPRWHGEPLVGKRVLIWGEQGLGDEILTATMLPDVITAGAEVTLLASARLVPLFRRSFPGITVDQRPGVAEAHLFQRELLPPELLPEAVRGKEFDYQMSQGDMGKWFRPDYQKFPFRIGALLDVDKEFRQHMRDAADVGDQPNKIVGISWHSRRNVRVGKLKGFKLMDFAPILKTPGVTFVNLQYGKSDDEIAEVERELGVKIVTVPDTDALKDMDAFAALVAAMDLVITVSNTAAHVAGALNIQTWVLTPEGPGRMWYWGRNRIDTPWYQSVVLFRQPGAMQWTGVINKVAAELSRVANSGIISASPHESPVGLPEGSASAS